MRQLTAPLSLALLFTAPVLAQTPATSLPPRLTDDECAVWARELSFAQSVTDHDAAAFARHLHTDAAFGASRAEPIRGRKAITERWDRIIQGEAVGLAWYPTRVTIGGVGDVAWSSGPSLFEDRAPDAEPRYTIGAFHSVWHRGEDGVWRVLFDDGVEGEPADAADVDAFHAGRLTTCPQG